MSDICTASLLPVVIGGAIGIIAGISSGLIGPYFIQRQKDAADKKRKRAEKFEELVGAVAEHSHWFDVFRFFTISGQGIHPTLSPITKIHAIVGTYFPEFELSVRQLEVVSRAYKWWVLDMGQKRVRGELEHEKSPDTGDVVTKYVAKQQEFLTELKHFARREFQ